MAWLHCLEFLAMLHESISVQKSLDPYLLFVVVVVIGVLIVISLSAFTMMIHWNSLEF